MNQQHSEYCFKCSLWVGVAKDRKCPKCGTVLGWLPDCPPK